MILRPQLRRIQRIEFQLGMLVVAHNLHAQLPLRVIPAFNGFVQILRRMAVVHALDLVRFFLRKILNSLLQRLPMIFDEHAGAFCIDPFICIHTGALHLAVVGRDAPRGIHKRDHMRRFRGTGDKIEHAYRTRNVGYRIRRTHGPYPEI